MSHAVAPLINLFTVGMTFSSIYFREHPRVIEAADEFVRRLRLALGNEGQEELFLGVVRGRIVADGETLVGPSLIARRYVDCVEHLQCGGMLFHRELLPGELIDLFAVCSDLHSKVRDRRYAADLLQAQGVRHIRLSPCYGEPGWQGQDVELDEEPSTVNDLETMIQFYQSLQATVEDSHERAMRGQDVNMNTARTVVESMVTSIESDYQDLLNLSRYPDYDNYTIGHSVRVSLFAMLVGQKIGLSPIELVEIGTAGLLHDIGKSKIPQEILFKTARLDKDELYVMRKHPHYGGEILLETEDSSPTSIGAAFGHHLRQDGKGYPKIPKWAPISAVTSLIQVCDVFEALTAVRPYKPSLTPAQSYHIMMKDSGAFDRTMLFSLVKVLGLYPPGSRVKLSTGEEGVVCSTGLRLDRPLVRITQSNEGVAFARNDQPLLDLGFCSPGEVHVTELSLDGENRMTVGSDEASGDMRGARVDLSSLQIQPCR
jgi:HD-GYP domain-containing protein (c-di-GMP phosphodiesterase class II)